MQAGVIEWLLEGDPAIRWQVMRDLTGDDASAVAMARARVAREGLGAEILARQSADGVWRREVVPAWRTTLFTMQMLRACGVDPEAVEVRAAVERLEAGVRWNDLGGCWELRAPETGGNTFFEGEEEPCINGGALALGAYFGRPAEGLARLLVREQLADGGWNCEAPGSRRSSFHTTICVLEGLLEYEKAAGTSAEVAGARRRGEEYLLERGLFKRLSTGGVAKAGFLELAFPPSYHYDVLRGLDYFRSAGAEPDSRMAEALELIAGRRQADGRWVLDGSYDEANAVSTGEGVGEASRWNTLRALRVGRWYEGLGSAQGGFTRHWDSGRTING